VSYAADVTGDLALWVAGWIRELLTNAPPPSQRNTAEWLLEQIDQAGLAPQNPVAEPLQAKPGVEQSPQVEQVELAPAPAEAAP